MKWKLSIEEMKERKVTDKQIKYIKSASNYFYEKDFNDEQFAKMSIYDAFSVIKDIQDAWDLYTLEEDENAWGN
jgi:hypothetical protein